MRKLIKWLINLFRRNKPVYIKGNDVLTVTQDLPKQKVHDSLKKRKVVLQRKRYKLQNDGKWLEFTQRKTVSVYGRNNEQLTNETSRKQKLYEMGKL